MIIISKITLHTGKIMLCLFLLVLHLMSNAQSTHCPATTLEEYFNCYGGESAFSEFYVNVLTTFIETEDAIKRNDYPLAKSLLDDLWKNNPIGSSGWSAGYNNQLGTNIGSPYGYYGLRMMDDIVNFRLNDYDPPAEPMVADMKVILVGCIESIQPRNQNELDNGEGKFVRRSLDSSLLDSDYRIIKQSIDLFTKYTNAITKGNLELVIEFIELPELCLEADLSSFGSNGVYEARPNLGLVWEVIDEPTFNETDWWMIIAPSAVPIGEDFEDDEFITGGMGADSKGSPLFIADDSWLIRKPYHLGEGDYTDIERRAYLPQWYQHEFYHHLYRIYPEFSLEVNGHDWFDRDFWPEDFVGTYEPDYYAESLYKRLQSACEPLQQNLITKNTEKDFTAFSTIKTEDFLGEYSLDNIGNDFHIGEVLSANGTLYWRNAAGVEWTLTPRISEGFLETGPDCPYPGSNHIIELFTNEKGELSSVVKGLNFNGDFYRRRFNIFSNGIPVEFAFNKYISVANGQSGDLYAINQQYYWRNEDGDVVQLMPNFNNDYFVLGEENDRFDLISYDGGCIGQIILGLKTSNEVYTAPKIDENNRNPEVREVFDPIEILNSQPVSIPLNEYFLDTEGDGLTYIVMASDPDKVSTQLDNEQLKIIPVRNGNLTIAITAIDSNRGATITELNVLVAGIVLSYTKGKVTIFPNPTSGSLRVEGLTRNKWYSIHNLSGLKVQEGFVSASIDVSGLSTGIYFLSLEGYSEIYWFYRSQY